MHGDAATAVPRPSAHRGKDIHGCLLVLYDAARLAELAVDVVVAVKTLHSGGVLAVIIAGSNYKVGYRLVLEIVPDEQVKVGQYERSRSIIRIVKDPVRPAWWNSEVDIYLLGTYSATKYKLFLENVPGAGELDGEMIEQRPDEARKLVLEFKKWRKELLDDEDWCATLVRFYGKGLAILDHAHEAMGIFWDYLKLRDSIGQNNTRKEFQYNFIAWWRYNNFTLDMNELRRGKKISGIKKTERRKTASRLETMEKTCAEAQKMVKEMMGL